MKYLPLLLLLMSTFLFSQKNGTITYKSYFAHVQATEELKERNRMDYQEALDEEMMAKMLRFSLDFNEKESLFYLSESLISDAESKSVRAYVTGMFYGMAKFYINRETDELTEQLPYSFAILLRNKKASFIDWNLTNESKNINGYTCYKATYTYIQKWKGREFPWPVIAWYCPEIPVSLGPVRYSGLPGLILELQEDKRGYIVEKIEFLDKEVQIEKPTEGEELTVEEIKNRDNKIKRELLNQE
ncbi:GLPGLI family protein [Flavobacterium jejuense]|uniref:GLPGLI family protein n=1 Tax=Flavobacterium jejuense TaxID=1544455 RepID=A0ABX0IWA5_9FLAO|nr:GLPGLI family protein [Flavobacterium jejuense]NHN26351.1 GLPGLI family protein [Flavobacterium jejuense]